MIPAGLKDGETEFYKDGTEVYAMCSGMRLNMLQLPGQVNQIVDSAMEPRHHQILDKMGIQNIIERRTQFLKCNCSSYDFTPDITDGQLTLQKEYSPCSFRDTCEYEGKFCTPIIINGQKVTMTELAVTSSIRAGLHDKEICDKMDIHPQTLRVHKSNIQRKLNADRKVGIAMRAVEYGIS